MVLHNLRKGNVISEPYGELAKVVEVQASHKAKTKSSHLYFLSSSGRRYQGYTWESVGFPRVTMEEQSALDIDKTTASQLLCGSMFSEEARNVHPENYFQPLLSRYQSGLDEEEKARLDKKELVSRETTLLSVCSYFPEPPSLILGLRRVNLFEGKYVSEQRYFRMDPDKPLDLTSPVAHSEISCIKLHVWCGPYYNVETSENHWFATHPNGHGKWPSSIPVYGSPFLGTCTQPPPRGTKEWDRYVYKGSDDLRRHPSDPGTRYFNRSDMLKASRIHANATALEMSPDLVEIPDVMQHYYTSFDDSDQSLSKVDYDHLPLEQTLPTLVSILDRIDKTTKKLKLGVNPSPLTILPDLNNVATKLEHLYQEQQKTLANQKTLTKDECETSTTSKGNMNED